uniref:Immunoglobulin subtype domain-containing protein n=1 Tax=Sus scrofa TaxID=9823 RepID=A0A8D1SQ59_PIG
MKVEIHRNPGRTASWRTRPGQWDPPLLGSGPQLPLSPHLHCSSARILLSHLLGALPRPSITAEPGPVVPWGQPVTIVCQGPAGAETFHLQYKENTHKYKDESNTIQISPHQTAARFPIAAVSEDTARCNRCFYYQRGIWSEPSEALELVLTDEDVSGGGAEDTNPPSGLGYGEGVEGVQQREELGRAWDAEVCLRRGRLPQTCVRCP